MPSFPRTESEMMELAELMLAGYAGQPAMFPHADAAGLQAARAAYEARRGAQIAAQAAATAATTAKAAAFEELMHVMQVQLRQSEVDTAATPQSLEFIGWAPRKSGKACDPPGQPGSLVPSAEGADTVTLAWKSPEPRSGGRVRAYVIERRDLVPGQPDTGWHQAGVALVPKATLEGQPRGMQLEYRVIAVNPGGQSEESNTAAVVL